MFSEVLFSPQPETRHPRLAWAWVAVLFLAGAVLWGIFFNWGKIPFDFHDWAEVNAPRLAFLKDAIFHAQFPLHMPDASALRGVTDRFLALPDVITPPQALLMLFLEVGPFVLVNFLLMYATGFIALLYLQHRYHLSLFIFTAVFLIFNFNGHVIAHLSVGHVTWGGYFLFPWLLILMLRLLEGDNSWRWVALTSALLFLIFFQGSFHQYVWSLMFLGLLGIAVWRKFVTVLKALVFANLLCMVRLLPPALMLGQFDTDFYGGYRLPQHLASALIFLRLPNQSLPFNNFNSSLGFWEFDLFIGAAGVLFITLGGLAWASEQIKSRRPSPFLLPILVLGFLSLRNFYEVFAHLPLPLLNAERVTSRIISLPFVILLILGAIALQRWLDRHSNFSPWVTFLAFGSLVYLAADLAYQTIQWRVTKAAAAFPLTPVNLAIKVTANHADPPYTNILILGCIISLVSLVVLLGLVWRERHMQSQPSAKSKTK
jgi:hypothetical protein